MRPESRQTDIHGLTLQVMDKHEGQRVAGDGFLVSIIDVMETSPELDKQHQGGYSGVSWKSKIDHFNTTPQMTPALFLLPGSSCLEPNQIFVVIPVLGILSANRRFPEITGEGNLTVFSYSGRVKSPEWR